MGSIFKPKRSRKYYIAFKDHTGKRITVPGYRDKTATQAKAKTLEREAERRHAGMVVNQPKPCTEAMDEWLQEMQRQSRASSHTKEARRILTTLINACNWQRITDVRPDSFRTYLQGMASNGRAPQTQNNHHAILKAWLNWCCSMGWLEENPIKAISMVTVGQAGKRHRRRAFTPDELCRLFDAAPWRRQIIYRVAAFSGLRRNELRQVTGAEADYKTKTWRLSAHKTKARRAELLPMTNECALALSQLDFFCPKRTPYHAILAPIPHITELHKDIAKAGIQRINNQGRRLDFHSFRYAFCSLLARKMPIQKVMVLMRHKDIRLTVNLYMDLGLTDLNEEDWKIPPLLDTAKENQTC